MNLSSIRICLLFALLIGCHTDRGDDPSVPVRNFYQALYAGDTAAMLNNWTSDLRSKFRNSGDSTLRMATEYMHEKNLKAEIKINEVHMDSTFPNMAVVHFSVKVIGDNHASVDSVNLHVAKEEGDWKISSLDLHRDHE